MTETIMLNYAERKSRVELNYKRTNRLATYRMHNLSISNDFKASIAARELIDGIRTEIPKEVISWLVSVQNCCHKCLYRRPKDSGSATLIGGIMCRHKLCMVCNSERSRTQRRKFKNWLRDDMFADKKTGEVFSRNDFSWQHLVLTVPHKGGKYKGESFYLDSFNREWGEILRSKWFKNMVFGGATNFEFTHNDNGFHIHNHTLILQNKTGNKDYDEQNRNRLNTKLLCTWNRLTIDHNLPKEDWTPKRIEGLRKSLQYLDNNEFERVLKKLDPRGGTFIHLKNLYVRKKKTEMVNGEKRTKWVEKYVDVNDVKEFSSGLMECLKYHFKPFSMIEKDKETGGYTYKLDVILDLLPKLHGRKLYRKFGNLNGVKALNVTDEKDEQTEALEEYAIDAVHPETFDNMSVHEYEYVAAPVNRLHFDQDRKRFRISRKYETVLHGHDLAKLFESLLRCDIVDRGDVKKDSIAFLDMNAVNLIATNKKKMPEGWRKLLENALSGPEFIAQNFSVFDNDEPFTGTIVLE